ncbi:MAG: bifunctional demethylmenaquinone methyltransferase/2-methoxy-6-polyprenyl-1,4-benzoquinol methylase UbiE [Rickettsiales bacterium]|nr:bifunctional demethylmenaquinone methyltransferase/2-methoxy-6-polyprenyl-1,4-benzoquinol methylase UbiE [Rickettsiales bacterium]
MSNKQTSFGFKNVSESLKTKLVDQVFNSVADKYDLMNDIMSLGIHRLWKDKLVENIDVRDKLNILDMASGTGDVAFKIYKKLVNHCEDFSITIADINKEMLAVGKDRAIDKNIISSQVKWQCENGEKTSFKSNMFDYYTIAYGIRNFSNIEKAVKEAYRILKKGGKFICLEFNQLEDQNLQKLYDFYSFNIIPKIGSVITGDQDSYQYFVESIRKFPSSDDFIEILKNNGFKSANYQKLTFGLTTLYIGEK